MVVQLKVVVTCANALPTLTLLLFWPILLMEVLLRGRFRVAPTALPLFLCPSRTIRVGHIADAERIKDVTVAMTLAVKLQAVQPLSELVSDF